MSSVDITVLRGVVLQEELGLEQLCRACGVSDQFIRDLVAYGVIEPCSGPGSAWRFPVHSLRRVSTAFHLQRDLEVNLAGIALALDLLDEIASLRARL